MKHIFINYFMLRIWCCLAARLRTTCRDCGFPVFVYWVLFCVFNYWIMRRWQQLTCVNCNLQVCDFVFQVLAVANAACISFCFSWPQGGILCVFNRLFSKVLHLFRTNRCDCCQFLFNILEKKVFLLWIMKFVTCLLYFKIQSEWISPLTVMFTMAEGFLK